MLKCTRKTLSLGLVAVMAISALAGCGNNGGTGNGNSNNGASDNSGGTNEIKQYTVDDVMNNAEIAIGNEDNVSLKVWGPQDSLELLREQCDAFVEKFKKLGRTIKIECVAQGEADAAKQVKTDPSKAADVFGFASDQGLDLFNGGYVQQVRLNYCNAIKENNLEGAYETVLFAPEGSKSDSVFAFPETGDNGCALFYDKSILSDDDVKTMEGIMKVCNEKEKKFAFNFGDGFYGCVIPFTAGGSLSLTEDKLHQVLNYDFDKVNAVAKAFVKLTEKSKFFKDEDVNKTLVSGFKNGTYACGVVGSWKINDIKEALGSKMGCVKLPTINVDGEDKQLISLYGYKNIGVNSKTKYPMTSQALAFYLTGSECQKQRYEKLGWGPSIKAFVDPKSDLDLIKNDVAFTAIYEQQNYSRPQVNILNAFWAPTGTYGKYVVDNEKSHDDATMKKEYDSMVDNIIK